MRRRTPVLLGILALLLATIPAAGAQESLPQPEASFDDQGFVNETPTAWFVQMEAAPVAAGGNRATGARQRQDFLRIATAAGLKFEQRAEYGTLFNGFSVAADAGTALAMTRLSGVSAVWPVVTIEAPDPATSNPDLSTALAMTGADVAQNELGLTGEGIKVAVMDTGIDYDHPDLGGCFGVGCRVFTGFDFVGNDFNASDPANDTPVPDDDPDDCNGHGTHVAGIVGANGEAIGVAPDVTFGAYKVFGCAGSTFADIMISAMEMALEDGMDVLNMSIGSAFTWPQYPTAVASDLLVDQGMVVVASIGNSGASGVYSAGAPGLGEKVIGVASFDNSHINALTFNVNPGGQQVPYLTLATADDPPTSGTSAEVVFIGRGCTSLGDAPAADPTGKVALLVRGDCTFQEKYQGAADAGAVGVVIHNNLTGLFAGGGVTTRGIFGIGISLADGQHIRSLLDGGETVTLDWTDVRINAVNPTGGLISSFSSYGLSPDLSLKPDIGAPGGLIRSTYPLELGGYATISGTSMSSPHVAGSVALLLEAKPGTAAGDVRSILMNSADPKNWWGNPGLGFLDNVHRQGAGMLDIPGAVLSTTLVTPEKLALGESAAGAQTRTLTFHNDGDEAVTYDLSFVNALSTGKGASPADPTAQGTFVPGFFLGNAFVAFSANSVTVPAGGTATVDATITPATGPNLGQYGGYIVVSEEEAPVFRVPFAGFVGDYQAIVAMPADREIAPGVAYPLIGITNDGVNFALAPPDHEFTMQGTDIPWILYHLDHQVTELRFEVEAVGNGGRSHPVFGTTMVFDFHPRNSGPTSFFAAAWDGTRQHSAGNPNLFQPVPDGDYRIVLKALKALGDPNNPDHWETVATAAFTIDRPGPNPSGKGRSPQ